MSRSKAIYNFDTIDVFAASAAATRINGNMYVKISEQANNIRANRELILELLADTTNITEQDYKVAEQIREYFKGLTFKILKGKLLSEFENFALSVSCREKITEPLELAVIASLPVSYERGKKRDNVDSRINMATGGLIGKVGDKVNLTVDVVKAVFSQNYNTFYLTGITNNDQVVFFAYKNKVELGTIMNIRGTVKTHRDNTTQLNRVTSI